MEVFLTKLSQKTWSFCNPIPMNIYLNCLFILFFNVCHAQIKTTLINKIPLQASNFAGCDYHKNIYYFNQNAIYKKKPNNKTITYLNYQYGKINSIDISNPLKIIVFYKDFNTAIILDNQLNEIEKIHFNTQILFVKNSTTNKLWLWNEDNKKIENYNYKTNTIEASSPVLTNLFVKDMKSNLNSIFLLTENGILTYDYLGNFAEQYSNTAIEQFQPERNGHYFLVENKIYLNRNLKTIVETGVDIDIKNFYVFNKDLYIFDGSQIFHFLIDKND